MARKKRQQVLSHSNGTHTWATAAMGNAERLVEVEMADIRPKGPRSADTDLSIEVGAIQIHLTAVVMDKAADFTDSGLEHPVG
jgi:hypothetical protein